MDKCFYECLISANGNVLRKSVELIDYDLCPEIVLKDFLKEQNFLGYHSDLDFDGQQVDQLERLNKDKADIALVSCRGEIILAVKLNRNADLPFVGQRLEDLKDEKVFVESFNRYWSITRFDRNKLPWGYVITQKNKHELIKKFKNQPSKSFISKLLKFNSKGDLEHNSDMGPVDSETRLQNAILLETVQHDRFAFNPNKSGSDKIIDDFTDLGLIKHLIVQ